MLQRCVNLIVENIRREVFVLQLGQLVIPNAEVAVDFGVCFIYRYENEDRAYASSSASACFSDFYSDAADFLFAKSVEEVVSDVVFNDSKYSAIEFEKIEANSIFVPRF